MSRVMARVWATAIVMASVVFVAPVSLSAQSNLAWDQQINGPGRFRVLPSFLHEAVLDKETGLVWERTPGISKDNWANGFSLCYFKTVGDRKGWRLPRTDELATLISPGAATPPLPNNHPFDLGTDPIFWSANTYAVSPFTTTYVVDFSASGAFYIRFKAPAEDDQLRVWCVRGPGGTADGM